MPPHMQAARPARRTRWLALAPGTLFRVLHFVLLAVMLSVMSGCSSPPDSNGPARRATTERLARFAEISEGLREELGIPGMAVAVLEGGELVWAEGFGLADRERGIPVTADTPFGLASVTKALASVVILRLEEEGLLSLDDRVVDFMPGFQFEKLHIADQASLRLLHLITHTSDGPPGTRYRYDGDLYCVLDVAARRACGKGFRELFFEEIANPLGMTHTAPNPVDPGLLDRFQDWLRARGEEPVLRDPEGRPYETCSLWDMHHERRGPSYLLMETLIPSAMHAARQDSALFSNRSPQPVDTRTRELFDEFFREDNRYLDIYGEMARPYSCDETGGVVRSRYRNYFSTGAGVNSSVRDLARFDAALDAGHLLRPETLERAWVPFRLAGDSISPYGLGWFSEEFAGRRLIWHGGEWDCTSALYLKIPKDRLTLIALANHRSMSGGFAMVEGTVMNSGLGAAFLRIFVLEPSAGVSGIDVDWRGDPAHIVETLAGVDDEALRDLWWRQLRNMETMYGRVGDAEVVQNLAEEVHGPLFECLVGVPYAGLPEVVKVTDVGNEEKRTVGFTLDRERELRVYAAGEITPDGRWDWGWIESLETGAAVWEMTWENTVHAGGSLKNRKADLVVRLPAGQYRLHFQSDDSHAFMNWNAAPPDHLFWGAVVCGTEVPRRP